MNAVMEPVHVTVDLGQRIRDIKRHIRKQCSRRRPRTEDQILGNIGSQYRVDDPTILTVISELVNEGTIQRTSQGYLLAPD